MNNFENILNQNSNSPGAEITLIDQQSLNPLTNQLDKLSGRAGVTSETPLLPNNLEDIKLTQKLSDIGVIPSSQLPYLQNQEVNSYLLTDETDELLVGDLDSVKLSSVANNYPTVLSALSPSLTPTISQNSISPVVPLVGDTFVVPGKTSEFTTLSFKWTQRDATFNNEIGVFVIDELGRVNGVAPGETNYAQAALQSITRQVIFSRGKGAGTHKEFTFKAGERLAFYLIQDSTTDQWLASNSQNQIGKGPVAFFSLSNVNPDQVDHVLTQTLDNGSMQLNWEDITGGGDRDFNDVVFTIAESRKAITVPGQRGQKVTTKFTWTQRDAAFNNELGLFIVDDPTGRIGNLLPQDPGYAQAALTSKSRQLVFASGQTQGYAKNLELPSQAYIGFYLIQNSSTEQFLSQNPQNQIHQGPSAFFFFPSANPNQFDHIIELSSNQLAWEDQTNGGDRDYNDLVFHYEFGSPVDTELLSPTLDLASESDSGVSNTDNITSDNTPTITGNAEVGAKVQLYSGSELLGQTTADTAGIWQITTNELNHGTQNFSAITTDIAGNISPASSPLNIFIDTINPIINLTNPIDIAPLQKGARLTGKIDGTGSGIASLSYRFDNYPEIPLAFNADGTFDQEIDFTNIVNGGYKLSIITIDIAGNTTNSQFNINVANSDIVENSAPEIISQPETDYIILRNSNTQIQGIALDTTQAGLAEIQGQAFLDFDRNGIKNLEAGLDGFVVELVNSATDEVVGMQVTRSVDINNDGKIDPFTEQGLYKFSNLQAGNYQVRQVTQDAWNLTSPASPIYNLTLNNGESKDGLNFGNAQNYFYQLQAIDGDGDSLSYSLISAPQDAKIDANTGKLIWTPPATGEYTFQVQVVDSKGGEDIQEFKLNVIDPNRLPSISSSPSNNAIVEQNYTYQIVADNPDLDGLNFQLNQAPQGMTISPDGLIQWTPQANQVGAQQVKLLVKDDRGGEVEQVFTILTQAQLANPQPSDNYAPVITSKPIITTTRQQYTYDVDAIDGDSDQLKYSLLTAPQGMSIDENTGLISWNTNSQIAEDYNINVQVADSKGGVDTQAFTLTLSNTVPGEISGIIWDDFNGNGIRDTSFAQGANPDIVFVFDVSLSAAFSFQGSLNGNQRFTTILEAEKAGLNALNQQLIRQGLGETARVSIISFAGDVSSIDMNPSLDGTQLVTNPIADNDNNGVLDFEQVIERTNTRLGTNFEVALQEAEKVFKTIGTTPGNGTLVFLSDGENLLGSSITDEVNNLKALGIKLYAFGVGDGSKLNDGDAVDDDLVTIDPNAKIFKTTDELLDTFNDLGRGQDVMEPALAGVKVYLDLNNNGLFDPDEPSQTTNNQSQFRTNSITVAATDAIFLAGRDDITIPPLGSNNPSFPLQRRRTLRPDSVPETFPQSITVQPNEIFNFAATGEVNFSNGFSPFNPDGYSLRNTVRGLEGITAYNGRMGSLVGVFLDDDNPVNQTPPTELNFQRIGSEFTFLTPSIGQVFFIGDGKNETGQIQQFVAPQGATRLFVGIADGNSLSPGNYEDNEGNYQVTIQSDRFANNTNYNFSNLLGGTYTVRQVVPNGYAQTFPGGQGTQKGDGYADVVLEYFANGKSPSPLPEPYGSNSARPQGTSVNGFYTIEPVNPNVVLGAPPPSPITSFNPQVNWLALPEGSYVTVGFTDETIIDGPGNDIFIRSFDPEDSAGESADVFVSSNGKDFQLLGRVNQLGVQGLDLASISFTDPVQAVRIVGVDNLGTSPGFDLVSVEVLPNSIGSVPGFYTVNLGAGEIADNRNFGNQNTTKPNQLPNFITAPITNAQTGKLFRYEATAQDPDGDILTYQLLEKPTGMAIDSARGILVWQPATDQIGNFNVVLQVQDGKGGFATQTFQINVDDGVDRVVPVVELSYSSNVVNIGESVTFNISATDNNVVENIALTIDGNPVTLNNSSATIQFNQAGVFSVVATATDSAGNIVKKDLSLRVLDPNDTIAPNVEIISPQTNKTITNLTDIIGSVSDDNLEFYRVDYASLDLVDINNLAAADPDFITIAEGKTNINQAVIGQFDPTILFNGNYVLRVTAQDFSGNINSQGVFLGVSGDNKLGNFRLELTDLSIPLAGIPIQINRVYDTLQSSFSSDFGFGWSLGVKDAKIQESVPLTEAEKQGVPSLFGANPFNVGTKVYLTNPEGRRVGFTFDPYIAGNSLLGAFWKPRFIADPGVYDKLEVDDINLQQRSDGSFGLFLIPFAYNPSEYKLTTKDGTTYKYDQFKGLQEVKDRNNNTLTFQDNGIFSSTSASIEFLRDNQKRITQIKDPTGKVILYGYDARGNLISVTDQAGLVSQHKYLTNPNYLEQIIDPRSKAIIRTEYDAKGRVKATKDALGNTISSNYDVSATGSTITQLDALGNTTTTIRDSRGNITSIINPLGAVTRSTYDANNNPVSVTDPRGFTTTRTFDTRGNITSITDALGNTSRFNYDQFNTVTSETDQLGRITRFVYNANGNLVELIDATGQQNRFAYDNIGRVSSLIDANGNTTTFSYDGITLGKPTQVTFPDGSTQQIEYNQFGQISRLVDENSNATEYVTDDIGRLIVKRDALGNETKYTYDAQLISSVIDPLGNVLKFEYDNAGRLIRQIDPFNGVAEFGYDALGRRISETDPLGRTTTTNYRPDGLIADIIDPQNQKTSFEYDLAGNQTAVIDPLGNRTSFIYDALGRQIEKIDPLSNIETYAYDAVNNLIQITDRNNRQRSFTYDGVNRLIQENWLNNSTPVRTINFTYDAVGNLVRATDVDSTFSFSYDKRDRVTQVSQTGVSGLAPVNLNYAYDGAGNRTSVSDNFGVRVNSTYDGRNLLTSQTWQGTGIDPARVNYSYDSRGDRTQIQSFSNLAGTQLVGSSTFNYDALQRLTDITHSNSAGSTLANYSYNYNLASFLNSETYKGETTNYTYDKANQLSNADRSLLPDKNYTYDANGNPADTGFTVGENNQILSDGQFNYTYDKEGNLATKTNISTGTVTTYNYDFRNRLVGVIDTDTSGNTTQSVEFKYDAFNRRIAKTVNGQTTYFVNDGDNLWAELNPVGEIINRYLQGANVDELIARYRPGEGTSWYLTDRLGTIRDMVNAVGNLVNSIDYDSFGEILSQTNPSAADRFTFAGREFDSETGLYYNRARYYDANLGRFISQDPIGFAGEDFNLYRYVGNDPVNATDAFGLTAALEYQSILSQTVTGRTGSVIGSLIGFLHGFSATNIVFIGNILDIVNAGGDPIAEWGTAIARTQAKMKEIEDNLSRFESVDNKEGLAEGFVSGAGYDIVKLEWNIFPDKLDRVAKFFDPELSRSAGFEPVSGKYAPYTKKPVNLSIKGGGFKQGYGAGLLYLQIIAAPN